MKVRWPDATMGALGPSAAIKATVARRVAAAAARSPVTYPTAPARAVTWNPGLKLSPAQVAMLQAIADYHATWPLDASGKKALLSFADQRMRLQKMSALMRAYDASMTPAQRAFRAAYYKAHKSAGGIEGLPWDDLAKGLGQVLPIAAGIAGAIFLAPILLPTAAGAAGAAGTAAAGATGAAVSAAGAALGVAAAAVKPVVDAVSAAVGKPVSPQVVADTAKDILAKSPGISPAAALQQAGSLIIDAARQAGTAAAAPAPAPAAPMAAAGVTYPAPVEAGIGAGLPAWAIPAALSTVALVLIMTKGGK